MYKEDLALNNLQWLICHKTKLKQTPDFPFSYRMNSSITAFLQGWL